MRIFTRPPRQWLTATGLVLMGMLLSGGLAAQCPTEEQLWAGILRIEASPDSLLSKEQKLKEALLLKTTAEQCHLTGDSVYARILHRIGTYQFFTTHELNSAIHNTLQSVAINTSGKKGACPRFAVGSYLNLGLYYNSMYLYDEALTYFDSSALLAARFPGQEAILLRLRQSTSHILSLKGDFQVCVEEATRGLQTARSVNDTTFIVKFLTQRAQAYALQKLFQPASADLTTAFALEAIQNDNEGRALAHYVQAVLMQSEGRFPEALRLYNEAIKYRTLTNYQPLIAEYHREAGNLLLYNMGRYDEGMSYIRNAARIASAAKDSADAANAYNSIGSFYFYKKNYSQALNSYRQTLTYLGLAAPADDLHTPGMSELNRIQNKELLLSVFGNKTECLLHLYKKAGHPDYLFACLQTAQLTDSLITTMRHEQTGEGSKLYWRNHTRAFFVNALEACWLANNRSLAFYFMEKSRAVLLNDKLNELGAFALLPPAEAATQRNLQIAVIEQQQALASISPESPAYPGLEAKLLQAKTDLERYIRSLEQKAPAYYQYKYADEVPPLDSVQRATARSGQSFIHYFVGDTVTYILRIAGNGASLLRLPSPGITDSLSAFLRLCSDRQRLNSNYNTFAALSNALYLRLFEPLHPSTKRIVICPDNFLIPFEALCSDTSGRHFLVYDHAFDYAYSARYWLTTFPDITSQGNFLGFAPVSFAASLHVPDLQASMTSIKQAAAFYPGYTCLTGKDASRRHFLEQMPHYTVVNVYSHAKADSTDNEPLLFLSDSIIRLSELQLLQQPSAQLVVLSACQTNVGKNAAGEGIYSLARGLASAGIPSVASTLWQADELATYEITASFHGYLSKGMRKDEALQKAKLDFLQKDNGENLLPYYWANMTLIGNAGPVQLKPVSHPWWWAAAIAAIALLLGLGIYLKKRS